MAQNQANLKRQQDLQQQYTNYKNNLQQLAQKIGDIEQDAEEHKLVLETLDPLPSDRKCFRMINGVLVERTVKDVKPALETNSEGLKKVLEELLKQYKKQQDEMEKWKPHLLLHGPSHSGVELGPAQGYIMSDSPPKDGEGAGDATPDNSDQMDRAEGAQPPETYDFDVKEQDRWLPIANGWSAKSPNCQFPFAAVRLV
ncbi:uncharacterized protein KY384_008458 [Bacidia gigantensis]|uniref:uncharacterized protein n=1 Tax=Bacidia gigantensis TaxID=2732470 RepID=UPI001D057A4F|nr:uncharacterized protein KY384_008458 [Bacidia gigantensis]KAG8527029.1 hypothetical protein KY384_008458 [Bacidia gigantensis]